MPVKFSLAISLPAVLLFTMLSFSASGQVLSKPGPQQEGQPQSDPPQKSRAQAQLQSQAHYSVAPAAEKLLVSQGGVDMRTLSSPHRVVRVDS